MAKFIVGQKVKYKAKVDRKHPWDGVLTILDVLRREAVIITNEHDDAEMYEYSQHLEATDT